MKYVKKSEPGKWLITLLRITIGWHFFYEGASKLFAAKWSAAGFLANATGPFSGFYHWLSSSATLMNIIDPVNMYALIFVGLALILGIGIRYASVSGVVLLILYYFAYPPFAGTVTGPTEGNLYIVNRNFIEGITLLVLMFLKDKGYGIYALNLFIRKKQPEEGETEVNSSHSRTRREVLKNLATLPVFGILGWGAFRNYNKYGIDTVSGATIKIGAAGLNELKGTLPKGRIGEHVISRLILGGNLIGGWAHSRDLLYVPSLFKAYNTERKVFDTLILAEQAGINAINIGFPSNPLLAKYKKITGSKLKVISQVAPDMDHNDYYTFINQAIDFGVDIVQVQGNWCDWLVRDKKLEVIEKMLDRIRSQGYTAGLGAHTVDSLMICEDNGIIPDYYMKTMHHDKYWSAHPMANRVAFEVDGTKYLDHDRFHDNLFCLFPEKTVGFVENTKVPVMGFKVLAAGAIEPKDGFNWAFQNGADFICVGMFDFQIVNDVNIAVNVLNNLQGRNRQWYG